MKITEGPYTISHNMVLNPYVESVSDGNDRFQVCECFGPDAEANARAIAKVPEMVKILHDIATIGENGWSQTDRDYLVMNANDILKDFDL